LTGADDAGSRRSGGAARSAGGASGSAGRGRGSGNGSGGGTGQPVSYAAAGVDIAAGDRAVELMRAAVSKTAGPEVVGGIGGFAGLFDVSKLAGMRRPLLATSTDGVGTKVVIAQRLGRYDTVGLDLVGMVVDDLVVCGAEPLFMTDYVVCGRVQPERVAQIVTGIAEGCVQAGCALIGGETAEHPGHLAADDFDLAGAATGVVDADRLLGPDRVRVGDAVIAMASSGLHANGFSLVRAIIDAPGAGLDLDTRPDGLSQSLGAELLTPTRIYARDCLALADACSVRTFAHVTGGGLAANLARVLPPAADAVLDRASWRPGPVFGLLADRGNVEAQEMERTFNMGVGMVAIVGPQDTDRAVDLLAECGLRSWVVGQITAGSGTVHLTGRHPA
jgi:phosphoribosylformylglycinamidine cyclo-ligase